MTAFADLDDVLTVADVAEFLKCSDDSVYRVIRDGKLATFTIGVKGVRISKAALGNYYAGVKA